LTTKQSQAAAEVFVSLRDQLLSSGLASMTASADASATGDDIVGVVMEVGTPRGTALVFGLRDGSASLYTSTGGGTLGGQGHPHINAAAKKLVGVAQAFVGSLPVVDEYPLPPVGQIRFSILTSAGVHATQVPERDLLGGQSELLPLFSAANEILSGFRLVDERGRPNEPLYINCLLTALARGNAPSVVLTSGSLPPDPATLTTDPQDLAWLAAIGLSLEAQSTDKIIDLILKAARFGLFSFGKKEGTLRTSLTAHDGKTSSVFDFRVTRGTANGRLEAEIVPLR
jgi:hypothetical protein